MSMLYPISQRVETRWLLCMTFSYWCNPHDHQRSLLQCRWKSYPRNPHLRKPILETRPTLQHGFDNYLRPAASMHLQVTSQCQPIFVTAYLASEHPAAKGQAMAPSLDVWLVASRLVVRFQIASWLVWVLLWHLCRSACSKSLHLHQSVLCTTCALWKPQLRSRDASWPMDFIRSTAESIWFTQWISREWLCNPASLVSFSECGWNPSIWTHGDASTMASTHACLQTEIYRLTITSECNSWARVAMRLQMYSISSNIWHRLACIACAPWLCGSPVRLLH